MTQADLVRKDFWRVLSWSGAVAGAGVALQLATALAMWGHASEILVPILAFLAVIVSFLGGLVCLVVFLASLLAYRLKGLWFALPVIGAWAWPFGLIFSLWHVA